MFITRIFRVVRLYFLFVFVVVVVLGAELIHLEQFRLVEVR